MEVQTGEPIDATPFLLPVSFSNPPRRIGRAVVVVNNNASGRLATNACMCSLSSSRNSRGTATSRTPAADFTGPSVSPYRAWDKVVEKRAVDLAIQHLARLGWKFVAD
ncbi:hypothetical protein [Promicromonospora sukumoe]|uniref:hypothetical protein n=1 Tax=Promicromonospora sukumoe TaxID=88382 RepID=UPI003650E8F8